MPGTIGIRGTDHEVVAIHTKSNGTFKARWDVGEIGNYDVRATYAAYAAAEAAADTALRLADLFYDELSHPERRRYSHLLYLDLDQFKLVNDTLGHSVGDGVLRLVSARLASCLRESDTLARRGEDARHQGRHAMAIDLVDRHQQYPVLVECALVGLHLAHDRVDAVVECCRHVAQRTGEMPDFVAAAGEAQPRQDALDFRWIPVVEALSESVDREFVGGRGAVLRAALATIAHR